MIASHRKSSSLSELRTIQQDLPEKMDELAVYDIEDMPARSPTSLNILVESLFHHLCVIIND